MAWLRAFAWIAVVVLAWLAVLVARECVRHRDWGSLYLVAVLVTGAAFIAAMAVHP